MKEEIWYDFSVVNNMLQGNVYKLMYQKFRFYYIDEIYLFYMYICNKMYEEFIFLVNKVIKFIYLKLFLLDYIKDLRNKKNG